MNQVPNDIIKYIGLYLDLNSLNKFRSICKKYNKILSDRTILKKLRNNNLIQEKKISIKLINDSGEIHKQISKIYYCLKCGEIETNKNQLIYNCLVCNNVFCKQDLYSKGIISQYGYYINKIVTNCNSICKDCIIKNPLIYIYKNKKDLVYITEEYYKRLKDREKSKWINIGNII